MSERAFARFEFKMRFRQISQIAKFMGQHGSPSGSCWPQMGPMLAPWTLLSGYFIAQGPGCFVLRSSDPACNGQKEQIDGVCLSYRIIWCICWQQRFILIIWWINVTEWYITGANDIALYTVNQYVCLFRLEINEKKVFDYSVSV